MAEQEAEQESVKSGVKKPALKSCKLVKFSINAATMRMTLSSSIFMLLILPVVLSQVHSKLASKLAFASQKNISPIRRLSRNALRAREVRWHVSASFASSNIRENSITAANFPEQVLRATPSIDSIKDCGENIFTATITQSSFPLVTLTPKMTFKVEVVEPSSDRIVTTVKLIEQKMEARGPTALTRIVLAASKTVTTESTTTFELSGNKLTGSAFVDIKMNLPRWIPIPSKTIQTGGQASMDSQIKSDLKATVEMLSK